MKRFEGIHFYINIKNFNDIVVDEETKTGAVTHSIHALDTFFSSIERYSKKIYGKTLTVEKITGSRLHIYVVEDIIPAYDAVRTISAYAFELSKYINKEIPKYKSLLDFTIQVGCAYGEFYDFEFTTKNFTEATTIGYAANFAAKIQAATWAGRLSISENIYEKLGKEDRDKFEKVLDDSMKKYDQDGYYTLNLSEVHSPVVIKSDDLTEVKEYANKVNLSEISYSGVRKPLNFSDLSKTSCKNVEGIPLFADVRGFTSQFDSDDENLDEMAQKTQNILQSMYQVTTDNGGVHIQFQGDQELALYHNTVNEFDETMTSCFKMAVLAAMRLVDAVKPFNVHIGVGGDYGKLYATKIGARGEKDNILIGKTVITADRMEDAYADEDQIAITRSVFDGLKSEDPELAKQFKYKGNIYVATVGFKEYQKSLYYAQHSANTKQNKYNGAWG
ncbi:MAG: hypothetical protein LUD73_06150 [Lachnospiraceae bacterium]|nr:hypothetical protein [Lachnospiraceae bacterium]